jgi:GTPase Era involved in 16S rRNA processing
MELTLHKLTEGFFICSDEQIKENDKFIIECTIGTNFFTILTANKIDAKNTIKDHFKLIAQQDQIDFSALSEEEQQEIFSDRKFTLEDMRKCFFNGGYMKDENEWNHYIQSISQPKSWKIDGLWENNKFKITKIC